MKTQITLALIAAPVLATSTVEARDQERLTGRASRNFRHAIRRSNQKFPRRAIRPINRIVLNNTFYRCEGNPNMRDDEVSGTGVMFHIENRRAYPGHAGDRQAR